MKRLATYLIASFVAVAAFADEIDAEIIKNLDFYEKIPVVEELDLIELEQQSRPPEKTPDADSNDESVQDAAPSKGEGK